MKKNTHWNIQPITPFNIPILFYFILNASIWNQFHWSQSRTSQKNWRNSLEFLFYSQWIFDNFNLMQWNFNTKIIHTIITSKIDFRRRLTFVNDILIGRDFNPYVIGTKVHGLFSIKEIRKTIQFKTGIIKWPEVKIKIVCYEDW